MWELPTSSSAMSGHRQLCPVYCQPSRANPRLASLQQMLRCSTQPTSLAELVRSEVPLRYAERMSMIETIPGWEEVRELREIHQWHATCLQAMQLLGEEAKSDAIVCVVKQMLEAGEEQFNKMVKILPRLSVDRGGELTSDFADKLIDQFYQNWIGSTALLSHFVKLHKKRDGIIDRDVDVTEICSKAAEEASQLCEEISGRSPMIKVEVQASDDSEAVTASIPRVLQYVVREVLKNSCQATLKACKTESVLQRSPVKVIVSTERNQVMIDINDEAGGIPDEVGKRVWSYMYTTSRSGASDLSGHGVGLPFARLYAQSLGGSLDLWSTPGHGTYARICLPRLESGEVDVNPVALELSGRMQSAYANTTATTCSFL